MRTVHMNLKSSEVYTHDSSTQKIDASEDNTHEISTDEGDSYENSNC